MKTCDKKMKYSTNLTHRTVDADEAYSTGTGVGINSILTIPTVFTRVRQAVVDVYKQIVKNNVGFVTVCLSDQVQIAL